ncbi:hypothetical protein V7146_23475 [Gottfriedia acidiceleris]|uniref:hypothetical protein n=1 Tax=Gottfriedia acidiceleris TaxID=371036 RepID=UPI002FFD9848
MFDKEWNYFYITIAIFLIAFLFIYFVDKYSTNPTGFAKSNKFTFIIGIVSTAIGFTLSGLLGDLQQKNQDNDTAMGILNYTYEANKEELKNDYERARELESYLENNDGYISSKEFKINNTSLDLLKDNVSYYNIFSKQFKKNYPSAEVRIKFFSSSVDVSKIDQDTLGDLKYVIVTKYSLAELLLEEKKYTNGKVSKDDYDKFIKDWNEFNKVHSYNFNEIDLIPVEDLVPEKYLYDSF